MGQHDIGDYFKDRVNGFNPEVNTDEIWANLDLNNKKRDRKFFFWIFGVFCLGFVVSVAVFQNSIFGKTDLHSELIPEESMKEKNEMIQAATKDMKGIGESAVSSKNQEASIIKNEAVSENSIQIDEKDNSIKLEESSILSQPFKDSKRYNLNTILEEKLLNSTQSHSSHFSSSFDLGSRENLEHKFPKPSANSPMFRKSDYLLELSALPALPINTLVFESMQKHRNILKSDVVLLKKPIDVLNKKRSKRALSFNLYSGLFAFDKSLELTDPEARNLVELKNRHESALEMISIGASIRHHWANGIFMEVGLEFQSINEKFQFDDLSIDTISTPSVVSGQIVNELSVSESWTSYNAHRLFTMPVSLGYEIQHNKWALFMQGGVLLSLDEFEGEQVDSDLRVSSSPSYYTNDIKLGYRFSGGISYALTDQLNMYVSPTFQSYLSSFVDANAGFSQNFSKYGVQVGVNYSPGK